MEKIKLFLADDHQILIDALLAFFKEQGTFEIVGAANDGFMVMEALQSMQPHILLLDLNMPKADGITTLENISKKYPEVRTIILSNYHQSGLIQECRQKGAWGYVLKNGSKEELLAAIETVHQGKRYFNDTTEPLKENDFYADEFMKKFQLTKREIDIIRLVCKERNSRAIAAELFISEFTVNTHRRNIMRKLNVNNTVGVINFARLNSIC
jgi:DNA-binding NarL/FixJ family response regulator